MRTSDTIPWLLLSNPNKEIHKVGNREMYVNILIFLITRRSARPTNHSGTVERKSKKKGKVTNVLRDLVR